MSELISLSGSGPIGAPLTSQPPETPLSPLRTCLAKVGTRRLVLIGAALVIGVVVTVVLIVVLLRVMGPAMGGKTCELSVPTTASPCDGDAAACCVGREECLAIVDEHFRSAARQTTGALRQTYGPGSFGGGSCGDEFCRLAGSDRFDVYDNSLAVIYLVMRGHLVEAKEILDTMIGLLYTGTGNARSFALLRAAYSVSGGVADYVVDVGNNAWAGMAFAQYAAATAAPCYARVARDILSAFNEQAAGCSDDLHGYLARLPPTPENYRSIEHNIDVYALAMMLGDAASAQRAQTFVSACYDRASHERDVYVIGTGHRIMCDSELAVGAAIPADAQFWNLLSLVDPVAERKSDSMRFVACKADGLAGMWEVDEDRIGNAGVGIGEHVPGVRFSNHGSGAQWEATSSAGLGMMMYEHLYADHPDAVDFSPHIAMLRDSVRYLLKLYGAMPASVRGGNYAAYQHHQSGDYPGGSDTGLGWAYFRYPHLAATAWAGFLLLWQADSSEPVSSSANPFASVGEVPNTAASAADDSCLPGAPFI